MGLKPGPKPIAKSTGKPDQRRRDNKDTPGNTPSLKPSKSTKSKLAREWINHLDSGKVGSAAPLITSREWI